MFFSSVCMYIGVSNSHVEQKHKNVFVKLSAFCLAAAPPIIMLVVSWLYAIIEMRVPSFCRRRTELVAAGWH